MIRKVISFIISTILSCIFLSCSKQEFKADRLPTLFPDYAGIIIPLNIAPLNFIVKENAVEYCVNFYGDDNGGFKVISRQPKIIIPIQKWKKLLKNNVNRNIYFKVSIKLNNGTWNCFQPVQNRVISDLIDPYIVYRHINAALYFWKDMSIVQRSLESFDESDILSNSNTDYNCMHCHTFNKNDPDEMVLHIREAHGGTFIKTKDKTLWLNTKTPHTLSPFVYPAWHPSGKYIAFSTNRIHQFFFGSGHRLNHVFDIASDIVVYDIQKNMVFTSPKIASRNLENLPNWSPDGKYLYYINCPYGVKSNQDSLMRYDLMRIHFDETTHDWGNPELLISAENSKMSASFPEASPDGRFVLFCMADYGYFTIGNPSSDLYMLDVRTGKYNKLGINSDQTESFHNWSSTGRWIVFASKRNDGIITLPYISYVDTSGIAYKPFVLPAKDPESLESRLFNYNRPVFVKDKVKVSQDEILSKIFEQTGKVYFDTLNVDIDALAGATAKPDKNVNSPTYRRE
jgi:hypothetical protein